MSDTDTLDDLLDDTDTETNTEEAAPVALNEEDYDPSEESYPDLDSSEIERLRTLAGETRSAITSDTRLAVVGYNDRLLIERLESEISDLSERIITARAERQEWYDTLVPRAVEAAKEHEWCGQFEAAMSAAGFKGITREEEVGWRGDVRMTVTLNIENLIDGHFDTCSGVSEGNRSQVYFDIGEITGTYESEESGCICANVERYLSRSTVEDDYDLDIPEIADDDAASDVTFEIESISCDRCDN